MVWVLDIFVCELLQYLKVIAWWEVDTYTTNASSLNQMMWPQDIPLQASPS